MTTYSRAGQFGPAAIPGAPTGVALRVLDAAGSDAVLYADVSKNKTVGPIVYPNDAGQVTFFADPGTYTIRWTGGSTTVVVAGGTSADTPTVVPHPNLLRVAAKLASGTNIKVTFVGDSGLEGNSVTTPGTDDTASRFTSGLAARFGVTVTKSNRAVSGNTFAHALDPTVASPTRFANALADAADLYVISYGHNDIRTDLTSGSLLPGNGYALNAGRAALEHMIRRIRVDLPEADIIVSSQWPYTGSSTSNNTALVAHGNMMRRVATQYGCAFVDYYAYLLGLGVLNGQDDTYVWPTGATGTNANAQHPNTAGHTAWADLLIAQLPRQTTLDQAPPPPPVGPAVFGAERYTHSPWLSAVNDTGVVVPGRWRASGTWTSSTTTPTTSSTASSFIEVQAIGTEIRLRLDADTGQGTVKIEVDGAVYNASLNLANSLGAGSQPYFTLTGLGAGAHRIVITVLSGSVTFRGALHLASIGQRIPYTSGLITYTGTWATIGTDATAFERNGNRTTTQNDTATVTFVGTGLSFAGFLYAAAVNIGVTVDGGTESVQDWNSGGTTNQQGGRTIVSGLTYGRHTVALRLASPTGSRALTVSNFFAFDETATSRPTRVAGLGVVGDSVSFANALPSTPVLLVSPDDATSTVPPSAGSLTTAGFTLAGTASSRHQWVADGGRYTY